MSRVHIPSVVDLMRLPAGDRANRLRYLARWHRERAAAAGSRRGVTTHQTLLRKVIAVAGLCGVEGIADA